ncbi:MAG TPA: hypothetical protein VI818_06915, partial [Candidatus Thermoplasmatota archaeon]|nr:hypothetical protein [Candidatus Thermoplasmatota archaeon]
MSGMDRNTRQRVSSALLTVTLVFALLAAYYALATGTTATKAFTQSFIFAIALGGATLGVRFWPERQAGPGVLVGGEHPLPQPNVVPAAASSGAGPPFEVAAPFPIGGLAERLQAHDGSNAARAIQINDLVAPAARNGHRKVSPVAIA